MNQLNLEEITEKAPVEMVDSCLFGEPHQLLTVQNDEKLLEDIRNKKCIIQQDKRRRGRVWEHTTQQHEVHLQNINNKSYVNWVVERFDCRGQRKLEGPFVNKEMKSMLCSGMLDETNIKRDCDVDFLPFSLVYEFCNNFIYEDPNVLTKFYKINLKEDLTKPAVPVKNATKVETFIANNKLTITFDDAFKLVKNKTKQQAMANLKEQLKRDDKIVGAFLDLLVAESTAQLLLDVDVDGFPIQKSKKIVKRRVE